MTYIGILTVIFVIVVAGAIVWFVEGTKIDITFKRAVYLVLFVSGAYWLYEFLAHGVNVLK